MNIKRSVRLTRRSYRRKLIMFGVSIFMSLALVATGFAAWVLSNDASKEAEGLVEIAAVHEESVEISDIKFLKDNGDESTSDLDRSFVFEPREGDTNGRVRYGKSSEDDTDTKPEDLDVKFKWSIDNYQIVGEVFVDFKIPVNVYDAIDAGWIDIDLQNADTEDNTGFKVIGDETKDGKDYKVLRYVVQTAQGTITANGGDGVVSYTVEKDGDTVTKVNFVMEIEFTWGEVFGAQNPGDYYDDDPVGSAVDYDDVKLTLNTFRATLHGLDHLENFDMDTFNALPESDQKTLCDQNPIPNYIIVINAQVA